MPRQRQEGEPRSDVERNRATIIDAAVRQLARAPVLEMRRLAVDAGVSRSTLYRRFGNADAVRRAVLDLYVVDIDGSHLLRLAGAEELPARVEAPLALGPELAQNGLPELRARLARELPGSIMAPMWLRGRAVGILLSLGGCEETLTDVARPAAVAIELANGYTDVFDAARRRKDINPAAEIRARGTRRPCPVRARDRTLDPRGRRDRLPQAPARRRLRYRARPVPVIGRSSVARQRSCRL